MGRGVLGPGVGVGGGGRGISRVLDLVWGDIVSLCTGLYYYFNDWKLMLTPSLLLSIRPSILYRIYAC